MKPSTSHKILTPSSLPAPLLMAEGVADSSDLQPALFKLATKPYGYEEVSYSPSIEQPSIDRDTHLSKMKDTTDLLYREQASSAKPSATYTSSESQRASSSFARSAFDSTASEISSTEDSPKTLAPFMKYILGEKTFNSVSLLSVSFFVSGILLMFYLIHLI